MKNKLKKKVFFYNGSLRMGGIERVMVDVLESIDLEKFDIDLVIEDGIRSLNVFEQHIPDKIKIIYLKSEELIKETKKYRERKTNIFYKLLYNLRMNYENYIKKKTLKKIGKKEYDIVIDFDMGLSKYIDLIKAKKKIVWIHASLPNWYDREDRLKRLGRRLKKYDTIVTICDEMKEETIKLYPYLKDKIVRVYNPISFERIRAFANKDVKPYMPLINEKYIVSVMRLTEKQKDFDTLIKAWAELINRGIRIKLLILGDGPDKQIIQDKIDLAGLNSVIVLMGNVENPYVWIKHSQMLVHSSKYEGFGLVLVEGLVLGKWVISSACEVGPAEILENGKLGDLYHVGDYEELANLVMKRLNTKKLDTDFIEKKIEKYSKEVVLLEYCKLMLEVE